ncbi:biotin transporter BioY [Blastochloris tepida]|uniref:Biotin transporter n=1 Tax=Blastochloris tepida TaxID=2233851 RepID=A0A348FXQ5_9HYPH|nr:biotin transporter BioY [Blastochloris tepida]BBF92088.1 biotin transporter BioY [Blastochloris tepida]
MTIRDVVLIALFAAIIVALGLVPAIPVAGIPVPITLQTLGVMLAGAVLGPKRGAAACLLVLLLVVIGLPVLAGGRGGLGLILSPTGGFLLGFVASAYVIGWLVARFDRLPLAREKPAARAALTVLACIIGGIVVEYAIGIPWLAVAAGLPLSKAALGALAFVPGDLVKAIIAGLVASGVKRVYPIAPK